MQARGYAKFVLNIEVTRIILLIKNRSRYGEMLNLKKKKLDNMFNWICIIQYNHNKIEAIGDWPYFGEGL